MKVRDKERVNSHLLIPGQVRAIRVRRIRQPGLTGTRVEMTCHAGILHVQVRTPTPTIVELSTKSKVSQLPSVSPLSLRRKRAADLNVVFAAIGAIRMRGVPPTIPGIQPQIAELQGGSAHGETQSDNADGPLGDSDYVFSDDVVIGNPDAPDFDQVEGSGLWDDVWDFMFDWGTEGVGSAIKSLLGSLGLDALGEILQPGPTDAEPVDAGVPGGVQQGEPDTSSDTSSDSSSDTSSDSSSDTSSDSSSDTSSDSGSDGGE